MLAGWSTDFLFGLLLNKQWYRRAIREMLRVSWLELQQQASELGLSILLPPKHIHVVSYAYNGNVNTVALKSV